MLDINSKKTKITSFKKRVKKNLDLEFYKGKQTIDIVHENRYLGTRTSSTGNCNVSLEHLREKTLLALFDLWKNAGISRLKPSLAWLVKYSTPWPPLYYPITVKFEELTRNKILKRGTAPQLKKPQLKLKYF